MGQVQQSAIFWLFFKRIFSNQIHYETIPNVTFLCFCLMARHDNVPSLMHAYMNCLPNKTKMKIKINERTCKNEYEIIAYSFIVR